jgi:hypothetical protein
MDDRIDEIRSALEPTRQSLAAGVPRKAFAPPVLWAVDLLDEVDRLQAKRNRIRSSWNPGDPPKCECDSKEPMRLVAHDTGDGWVWHWDCDCGHYFDEVRYEVEWPFIDDVANAADWELAGFEVV